MIHVRHMNYFRGLSGVEDGHVCIQ